MAKQTQQQQPFHEERTHNSDRYHIRMGWFVIPFLLIGLYALFKSASPSITWDQVMEFLNVDNKSRYSMLAIWCLALILVTALWRILRK
jgi:hypothetical protein